jgi:hypothetical protein
MRVLRTKHCTSFYPNYQEYFFLCVCVCVCVCVCIYMYVYIHIYIHIYIHTYIYAYIHTCIHTYICIRKPLLKDSYDYIASVVQESNMSAENPRKNTDGNFEVLAEPNLSLFHQNRMDLPEIKPRLLR